jgi:predicted GNAT family acetyltransferase
LALELVSARQRRIGARDSARRLSATVAAGIEGRGDRPFLHAWKSNHSAISLYEGLGFALRTEVNAVVLKRSGSFAQ